MKTALKALGLSALALAIQVSLNLALTHLLLGFKEDASRTLGELLPMVSLAINIGVVFATIEFNRRGFATFVEDGTPRSVFFASATVLAVLFAVFWALYSFMLFQ